MPTNDTSLLLKVREYILRVNNITLEEYKNDSKVYLKQTYSNSIISFIF